MNASTFEHIAGFSCIQTPASGIALPGVPMADRDFIAHAGEDIPRLLAEVRRIRNYPG